MSICCPVADLDTTGVTPDLASRIIKHTNGTGAMFYKD